MCNLTDEELAQRDIADIHLRCAIGLPGTEDLDIAVLIQKLDEWADLVDYGTRRAWPTRWKAEHRRYTEGEFRMLVLTTVLQRNLRVGYNRAFSEGEYDGSDARNLFLHGVLTGNGGTCVTMPVLYIAVGRRLGYPLKLVSAKEHFFCRWDDPGGERFNIEATSPGFRAPLDDYYHQRPCPLSKTEIEHGWYLRSFTPREELAHFLCQRGHCHSENLQAVPAMEVYRQAHLLVPDDPGHHNHWGVSILIYKTVQEVQRQRQRNPRAATFRFPCPIDEDWARSMYPEALRQLNRIMHNASRRESAGARDQVFKSLYH